ncbi:intelectin-like [Micropterus dolomieu]|uniref:intelectin-like n=1 Tax=Micropterus dolomieu TaxID=147949 RepID=UPI001E8CAC26|nr:intelectin-like [Micropterus dolomieu]
MTTANGMVYQTFCDITTTEGGWTLVATVHENSVYGRCTNPGYYDIVAEDMSVWHVPNNFPLEHRKLAAILRYYTDNRFCRLYGGKLFQLFLQYPVRYNIGSFSNRGPGIPIVFDHGDRESTRILYGPNPRVEFEPDFITFRAINNECSVMAICSGVKPTTGYNTEHYCIGGGGYFHPDQCGDFHPFDWNRLGREQGWSSSKEITEAAVLLFYC